MLKELRWANQRPAASAALILLLGFGWYLFSDAPTKLDYDAGYYWQLAGQYWPDGKFHFRAFDSSLRGYFFPLLLSPLTQLAEHWGWHPMNVSRVIGAATAALLFGAVGPGLWQALVQKPDALPVSLSRRLLFGALGFIFWRGYFHYPLTDFPALLALAGSQLLLLRRRSPGGWLLAGALLAAAVNFRPVYFASLPAVALLALWPRPAAAANQPEPSAGLAWGRRLAFVAGLAVVMWPQAAINHHFFGITTPLVLTSPPDKPSLYLAQLQGGLRWQKYETNVGSDYPGPQMAFNDPEGAQLWETAALPQLDSYAQYWHLACAAPLTLAGVWGRHLFNGLDVQYPTPYVEAVYVPTWPVAGLNYLMLLGGLGVLVRVIARWRPRHGLLGGLVMAALLLPCLAVLPVVMECRFLLPLHLLLGAALAFGAHPRRAWQARSGWKRAGVVSLYAGGLCLCFLASMNAQAHLAHGPRKVFEWQQDAPQTW